MLPTNQPRGEREPPGPASRLAGAVWGHLVGDAVGVPYEFREPADIGDVVFGASGTHGQPPGTWSDDGALMLATLDGLLQPGRPDPSALAQRYLAWYRDGAYTPDNDGPFDIGRTTRAALDRLAQGVPAAEAGPAGERDSGNGSLMRILPVALVSRLADEGALAGRAHQISKITHGHPRAQVACALYTLLTQRLTNWGRPSNAIFAAKNTLKLIYLTNQAYAPHLVAFDELVAWKERTGGSYVLDSFWSAWDAVAGASSFEDAIRRAIAYGHDTDTTAALAGGLAGAHWGWEAIPRAWFRGMRGRSIVTPLVDRLLERETGTRTSTSSPLRVDEIDLDGTAGLNGPGRQADRRGRLAITFLPGKKVDGRSGPQWRDLDADVGRLEAFGADVLFLLVADHELEAAMVLDLPAVVEAAGIDVVRFPVPDPGIPEDDAAFRASIRDLGRRLEQGQTVVVACRGGLDRSGLAAACVLRERGLDAASAISRVQAARSRSLTRDEHLAYVRGWPTGD